MIQEQTEQPYLTKAEVLQLKYFAKTLKSRKGKSLKDIFRFNSESKFVVPQKYVGVICLRGVTVEILPKTENSDVPETDRMSLVEMLALCYSTKLYGVNAARLADGSQTILDVFIRAFCDETFTQIRKGVIRRYVEVEGNLPVLRGRLDMTQHLRLNMIDKTQFYCRYDELQIDNRYNRILKYTFHMLERLTVQRETHRHLQNLLGLFDEVQEGVYTADDIDRLTFDRLTERYRPLFNLAKLFLANSYPDVKATPPRQHSMAFLINMDSLFEEYLRRILNRILKDNSYKLSHKKGGSYLGKNNTIKGLETDFRIEKDGKTLVILDAKWKTKASGDNYYQMYSYAHCYKSPYTVLLFPASQEVSQGKEYAFNSPDDVERKLKESFISLKKNGSESMNQNVEQQLRTILKPLCLSSSPFPSNE
jgi:5-methylcytosine-specific restriction enzyme subunit McrC